MVFWGYVLWIPYLLLGLKGLTNWGLKIPQHFRCGHPKRADNLAFNNIYLIGEGYMELLLVPWFIYFLIILAWQPFLRGALCQLHSLASCINHKAHPRSQQPALKSRTFHNKHIHLSLRTDGRIKAVEVMAVSVLSHLSRLCALCHHCSTGTATASPTPACQGHSSGAPGEEIRNSLQWTSCFHLVDSWAFFTVFPASDTLLKSNSALKAQDKQHGALVGGKMVYWSACKLHSRVNFQC